MIGLNKKQTIFRLLVYFLALTIFFISLPRIDLFRSQDITMLIIFVIGYIPVSSLHISISAGKGHINLVEAVIAFIFWSYGRDVTVVFTTIATLIDGIITKKSKTYNNEMSKIIFNVSMFAIAAYGASNAIDWTASYFSEGIVIPALLRTCGFVGVFLAINIILFKLDNTFRLRKYFKFDKTSIVFLTLNFFICAMLSLTLSLIHASAGVPGSTLVLGNLIIIHYCFYIYRKLQIRNESIKGLLKITGDVVKYGDFRDKCKHLITDLRSLIPYNLCAVYTFDPDCDTMVYPIAYNAYGNIDIGDLGFDLSSDAVTIATVREGKIYTSHDIRKDKRVRIIGKLAEAFTAVVFVPITIENKVVGIITIGGGQELAEFMSNGMDDMLTILSNQMALAIENDGIYRDIKNKADVDPLTKLYNRRVFDREIESLIKSQTPFSLVIYDIDNFKQINDTYGHLVGDEVLKMVSNIIRKSIRKTDIPCRFGGEEIVIILKDLSKEDALIISDRIRQKIEKTPTYWMEGQIFVTVSGGVSSFPEDGTSKEEIIRNADEVMYRECKKKGKNKVCAYKFMLGKLSC
jgi:diguanylate cyclase (GGDEF)-like protein